MPSAALMCTVPSVHPHRRGEHPRSLSTATCRSGSSPQAWGTWPTPPLAGAIQRFIPTGVGNISTPHIIPSTMSVHPHRRGEHSSKSMLGSAGNGSSPQAWGTLYWLRMKMTIRRFIPTGVGNIGPALRTCGRQTVHPHRRGEHCFGQCTKSNNHGSSPQAWGTSSETRPYFGNSRFIPTGVGNIQRH